MVAAPLIVDATFPHSTRSDTEYDSVDRTRSVIGPEITLSIVPPGPSGTDNGNMLPRLGCHHRLSRSIAGTHPPSTAKPNAGETSRPVRPICVTDAATRVSTASVGWSEALAR